MLAFPDLYAPLIAETDASRVSVGKLLAWKKEDGKIHPMQNESRTMDSAERNYTAYERKSLAHIFALSNFRLYLLSKKPFKLITDHWALQYAFKDSDVQEILA